eukprot:Skav234557  [mRNA]  locus=scaffold2556:480992:487967:+ [translate_table: standard]
MHRGISFLACDATKILKKQQLNIRDARISTNEDSPRASHVYVVQDKVSGSGLSEDRLAQVRDALRSELAIGDCHAEPWPRYSSKEAELPAELMLDSFIRHHHPVPVVDPKQYRLCVDGIGTKSVTLCLEDLKSRFVKREVVATLQCGGNRRSELDQIEKTSGIPWGFGAMSTAKFGGLSHENVEAFEAQPVVDGNLFVLPTCLDVSEEKSWASIPVEKALSPYGDVLLAYEMNDEALNMEHGAPVRVVVRAPKNDHIS